MRWYSRTASYPQCLQDSVPSAGHPLRLLPSGRVNADMGPGHLSAQSSSASSLRPLFEFRTGNPSRLSASISEMAASLSSREGRTS